MEEDGEDKKRVIDELRDRMVGYEATSKTSLLAETPWMVRIDGHKFSNWAKCFEKPADAKLHQAMVETAADLLDRFNPALAYTQSDEITLVFPPGKELIFGGGVQKITSIMASFAGVRFCYHILQKDYPADSPQRKRAEEFSAHFDARAFNVPTQGEAYNNLLWRSSFDCRRNSVFSLARAHFSSKQLQKLGTTAIIEKLKKEKNVDWEQQEAWFKYGTFVKKELYERTVEDPRKKGEQLKVIKSRPGSKAFLLGPFNEENIGMVFAKYWEGPLAEAMRLQEERQQKDTKKKGEKKKEESSDDAQEQP